MSEGGTGIVQRVRDLPAGFADGLLGALFALIGIADMYAGPAIALPVPYEVRDPDFLGIVLILVMAGSLVWRRRWPDVVLAVSGIGNIVYNALGYPDSLGAFFPVLVALYSTAAHGTRKQAIGAAVATAIGMATALFFVSRNLPGTLTAEIVIANYVIFATAWILGDNLRQRRLHIAGLEQRADELEVAQEHKARRAAAEERARIARELHDVVAHSLSLMVVQAGAGRRVADTRPEKAAAALESVEAIGREALDDMRRLLGVLRTEDRRRDRREPQPSLAHIDRLVGQVRDAGLPVELDVGGTPRALPPGVDLSAYRVVQEALTNAVKHAGRATAEVRVVYGDEELEIEVRDDGRGATSLMSRGAADGQGIPGMRERIRLFGGEFRAGPRPGGGYRVRARIPLEPPR